jgi:hypothetical protein
MGGRAIRGYIAEVNWARILMLVAFVGVFTLVSIQPAFAFADLADNIVGKATEVSGVIKKILFAAAVVSVLAGAAPMLWGEVKVKWIVSALAACVVISLMGGLVNAFVNG